MIMHATRKPLPARAEHSTLFDELNPHLRNVQAASMRAEETAYQYLLRRGPQPVDKISQRMGHSLPQMTIALLQQFPDLFRCERGMWSANPARDPAQRQANPKAKPERALPAPVVPRTDCTTARAIDYLRANGPATSEVIGMAVGTDSSTISSLLGRRPDVVVVETKQLFGRRTIHVWGIRE